jgi:hypothetical protein
MTSQEIQKHTEAFKHSMSPQELFLAEIAYQLAVANERELEKQPLTQEERLVAMKLYDRLQTKAWGKYPRQGLCVSYRHFDSLELREQRYWNRVASGDWEAKP